LDAAEHLDREPPGRDEAFLNLVYATLAVIARGERTGVRIGQVKDGDLRHVVLVGRFAYSLIVVLTVEEVIVVAVSHGRRRPRYWRDRVGC
jgi:plasmid stabilization system protein ParE